MTAIDTLEQAVESLCGDLSSIRAPRGSELNAQSWSTEAPLRMLLNNLDREVAERPEELVVNIVQAKQLTNFREKPSGTSDMLVPPRVLSLDDAIQYLDKGDLLEVTPKSLRIRKRELRHDVRIREVKRAKKDE